MYLIPGCDCALGEGSGWDLRIGPAAPAVLAALAPAAPGPKPGPKPGPLPGPKPGPKPGPPSPGLSPAQVGSPKNQKIKNLKIKICYAQNVGKVWISRKKSSPGPPGPIWDHLGPFFCVGRKNPKIAQILPIFLGGPMGPIHPVWGPCCYPPEVGQ